MRSKIIFKELSYKVVGILFEVFNELGGDYQEKYYQRAVEKLFKINKVSFKKEYSVDVTIQGEPIGKHYIDFVIENKLALDLKKGNRFRIADIKQMLMYLKSSNLKLGLLAYFGSKGVRIKRIINSKIRDY